MSETTLQTASSELVKQVRDANDLCHAAFNFFGKSEETERKANEYRSSRVKRIIWGIILTAIIIPAGVNMIVAMISAIANSFYDGLGIIGVLFVPIGVIIDIIFANLYFRRFAKAPLKMELQLRKQADEERTKGESLFVEHAEIFKIIPEQYLFPLATDYIYEVLRTGRAQTMNEALDRTDVQLHRWKLEQNSAASLSLQVAQLETLKRIERNTFWDLI